MVGVTAAALHGRMRRGATISLGACTVPAPLYMEQALAAALRTPQLGGGGGGGVDGDGGGLIGVLGTVGPPPRVINPYRLVSVDTHVRPDRVPFSTAHDSIGERLDPWTLLAG